MAPEGTSSYPFRMHLIGAGFIWLVEQVIRLAIADRRAAKAQRLVETRMFRSTGPFKVTSRTVPTPRR